MQAFAGWLRAVRLRDGRSQVRLAADCQQRETGSAIYQSRLTEWENGKDLPSLRQLILIAIELRLADDEIAEGRALWDAAQIADLVSGHAASEAGELAPAP